MFVFFPKCGGFCKPVEADGMVTPIYPTNGKKKIKSLLQKSLHNECCDQVCVHSGNCRKVKENVELGPGCVCTVRLLR